jgi:hypothetical protein
MALTKGPTSKDPFLRQGDRELRCECIRNSRKARPAFTAFGGEYRLPGRRFSGRSMLRPYGIELRQGTTAFVELPVARRAGKSKEPAGTPAVRLRQLGFGFEDFGVRGFCFCVGCGDGDSYWDCYLGWRQAGCGVAGLEFYY